MTFSSAQDHQLFTANMIASTMSFCGSLTVALSFIYFKKIRSFAFRLVFFLALSDLVASLGRLYGKPGSEFWCTLQSFQTNIFDLCSLFWVASVATVINQVRTDIHFDGEKYIKYCHSIIWPLALIISILPFTTNSYGPAGGWCWIKNRNTADKVWIIAVFYGELLVVFFYIVYVYFRLYLFLLSNVEKSDDAKNLLGKVVWFPLVLFVCSFFGVFRRIFEICGGTSPFWMALLHILLYSLLGFGNAVVYGIINSELRNQLQKTIFSCVNEQSEKNAIEMDSRKTQSRKSLNEDERVDIQIRDSEVVL